MRQSESQRATPSGTISTYIYSVVHFLYIYAIYIYNIYTIYIYNIFTIYIYT